MSNGYNQYVGMRYVPIIDGVWSSSKAYEPLVVVTYDGNSYISKTYVPAGTLPTNETYWILSANYNAQVEQYRQEVRQYQQTVDGFEDDIQANADAITEINETEFPADRDRITALETGIKNPIIVRWTEGSIGLTFGSNVQLTAPTVTGYTFVCWVGASTVGWVGNVHPRSYEQPTTTFWNATTGTTSGTGTIEAYALFVKNSFL